MKWKQIDKYHIRSGSYTIAKFSLASSVRYGAFYGKVCLGYFDSADEAKKKIGEHK